MDPGLHAKQGLNHLTRILNYAKFVEQEGEAVVHLTFEDWHVLADTLFHMDLPPELVPPEVLDYALQEEGNAILISTGDCRIIVEMM